MLSQKDTHKRDILATHYPGPWIKESAGGKGSLSRHKETEKAFSGMLVFKIAAANINSPFVMVVRECCAQLRGGYFKNILF